MKHTPLLLLITFILMSCGTDISTQKEITFSPGLKLAIVDGFTDLDSTNTKVVRIKTLVRFISQEFKEPEDTIAEYTSKTNGLLKEYGIERSNGQILEDMNESMTARPQGMTYKDMITAYAYLKAHSPAEQK